MRVIETESAEETFGFAKELGKRCTPGTVIGLMGDLGTGKTVFSKGVASGLGIRQNVSSPTYTIVQQYDDGKLPLFHFDVYRTGDVSEMDETGFDDCINGEGVTLVEWADMIKDIMPEKTIWITIEKDRNRGFDHRRITIENEHTGD